MNEIEAKVKKMCRGCFVEASSEDDMHSFQWPEIRELFEECTAITVSFSHFLSLITSYESPIPSMNT